MNMDSISLICLEDLPKDYVLDVHETMTPRRMRRFGVMSHDLGLVHWDPYFAALTQFQVRIVHGGHLIAYLSAVLNKLLGHGAIVIRLAAEFQAIPVGAEVVFRVKFIKVRKRLRVVNVECSCFSVGNEDKATKGTAEVYIMPPINYHPKRHQRALTWIKDMVLQR